MFVVVPYEAEHRELWDNFISSSKNGTFLFYRKYMEYHSHRFVDHSLLFFENEKLVAVMPANINNGSLISHGGLTYGGIISDQKMRTNLMLEIFDSLRGYMVENGFRRLIYKAIPYIYHSIPSDEDLYALFVHNARLVRRDLSSAIRVQNVVSYSKGRKWAIKKAREQGINVRKSFDFSSFMSIEAAHLQKKYGITPVHTAEEMELLATRFPENIKLFASYKDESLQGGVIIYESNHVAHAQYIATTSSGRELGAVDVVLDYLINDYYLNKRFFDFGISTEQHGRYLNSGLIQNKESFGATAVVYDFYEMDVSSKSGKDL